MSKKIDISTEINDLERYNIFSTMMSRIFFTCEVAYSGASTSSVTTDQRTKIHISKRRISEDQKHNFGGLT